MTILKITRERWVQNFPFLGRFHPLMEQGIKTMTTRPRKIGGVGYKWIVNNRTYRTVGQCSLPLSYIANHLFLQEGCDDPHEFIDVWNEIHPFKQYQPDATKVAHFFQVLCDDQHPVRPELHCDIHAIVDHEEHHNQTSPLPWNTSGLIGVE